MCYCLVSELEATSVMVMFHMVLCIDIWGLIILLFILSYLLRSVDRVDVFFIYVFHVQHTGCMWIDRMF
jgi:hypothetical protein